MIRKTLMVSLTCCLVLNLHIVAFADCPATPPPPPSQTEIDAFVAFQGSVFNTLFASSWAQEDMAYPLSTRVDGLGIYQGTNRLGQPFTFSVLWEQPIDLAAVCMTDEQRQQAVAEDVTARTVAGSIITPLAEVQVVATAISGFQDGQELVSYFIVMRLTDLTDPNGPFLGATPGGGQTQAIVGPITPEPFGGGDPVIQPCPDSNPDCGSGGGPPPPPPPPPPPCADCDQCLTDHQNDVNNANAQFAAAIAAANAALRSADSSALTSYLITSTACALGGWWNPFIGIGCLLAAGTRLAAAGVAASLNRDAAVSVATAIRDAAIAAADQARDQCLSNFNCLERGCI